MRKMEFEVKLKFGTQTQIPPSSHKSLPARKAGKPRVRSAIAPIARTQTPHDEDKLEDKT
jgi:hypothetical protein